MSGEKRSLELSVDVIGTPKQVWQAVATGPGITSWYVPHEVEEASGGTMTASFGSAPEMQVTGRVATWEPPTRVVFDGGDPSEGLVFDWLIEPHPDGGSCTVRLVNGGFDTAPEWDAQYDAMEQGWKLFLRNLQLHLEHFAGQSATASLPMAGVPTAGDDVWPALMESLGVEGQPGVGDVVRVSGDGDLHLQGQVVEITGSKIVMLVDSPAPGTAFIAAEQAGGFLQASIWSYLYGEAGKTSAVQDGPRWQAHLDGFAETVNAG